MAEKRIYTQNERKKITDRVFMLTLLMNIVLAALKMTAGIIGRSSAMISDAVNTISDIATTALAMVAVRLAGRKGDAEHPYGHEKIESVAGLLLACVLTATALMIGKGGIDALIGGRAQEVPGAVALGAAVISIICQEVMFHIAKNEGAKVGSSVIIANAWHHRSDALSSIGSLVGIGAARWFGLWYMEPAASLIICGIIVFSAYKIGVDCVNQLIDAAPSKEKIDEISLTVMGVGGVRKIDMINCRRHANKIYADIELALDCGLTFEEAHDICETVHRAVESAHPEVIHCMVHANPARE